MKNFFQRTKARLAAWASGRPKDLFLKIEAKVLAWAASHPRLTAWAAAHPRLVNRKTSVAACILLALILFFPIRIDLHDGGSVEYRALTYSLVRWEFFKGDEAPDPNNKAVRVRLYAAPYHWVRNVWERQGDMAQGMGCFTYAVESYTSGPTINGKQDLHEYVRYFKTVNGYRTNDFFVQEDGGEIQQLASNPFTLKEIRELRSKIALGQIRPARRTPSLDKLVPHDETDITSEEIMFCRVGWDEEHDLYGEILPVKFISYTAPLLDFPDHRHPFTIAINLLDNTLIDTLLVYGAN